MSLITEKVKENAMKCQQCAFLKMLKNTSKSDVLYDEAQTAVKGIMRVSCRLCPYGADFEKMYGKKPYDYYKDINE